MKVELSSTFIIRGGVLPVLLEDERLFAYKNVQAEIFDTAVPNRSSRLGFGTAAHRIAENTGEIEIDSNHLTPGIYELRLIRLHGPNDAGSQPQIDFVSGVDFSRAIFEVGAAAAVGRPATELLSHVTKREHQLEQEFLAPVDIRKHTEGGRSHVGLVFVRDVLLGTPVRLRNFEVIPTNSGLEQNDSMTLVNRFLRERTRFGMQFNLTEEARARAEQEAPVCVVHFPNVVSSSAEDTREYCVEKANRLLLALSLIRDASGSVFDIIVLDRNSGVAQHWSVSKPYIGNLLTGSLAGESADSVESALKGLEKNAMNDFLVRLYKEARREASHDFQYFRFWQVLEAMADLQNYDSTAPLFDFEGNAMTENGQPLFSGGSIHTVFRMLREAGIGTTDRTWKKVNVWFALRSAVAHYGSIGRYGELTKTRTREWARVGVEEIQNGGEFDKHLWDLKEDTKLLLIRRLHREADMTGGLGQTITFTT